MKVLAVVHDYLPEHLGGTEIHAHQMARHLLGRGHRVTVAFTERDLGRPEGSVRRGEYEGVPTVEVVHQREYAQARESFDPPLTPRAFAELLGEERPDLVHFHHLAHWGAECLELAHRADAAVVVTLHDYHLLCGAATLLRPDGELCTSGPAGGCTACLEHLPQPGLAPGDRLWTYHWRQLAAERLALHRWYLRRAARVICPSHFLAARLDQAGLLRPGQATVLRAGYPGPRHALRAVRRDAPLRVGYVGGIYPSKGVHVLVDALARLAPGLAELHVHGILEWFPDYVAQLRAAAAGAAVTFHGRFAPAQVDQVLQGLDVLVVPSIWYENMPLTIQEAFRNGLPVVATDLGGMAEAVRHGVDGLLFPRGDAGRLAELLAGLAQDRELLARLAAGRPEVLTVEQAGAALEELYGQVLAERARAAAAGRP
jgi:glycosyltransferase involved in cell wall biosynthesis